MGLALRRRWVAATTPFPAAEHVVGCIRRGWGGKTFLLLRSEMIHVPAPYGPHCHLALLAAVSYGRLT
jgi:hypothetical protein